MNVTEPYINVTDVSAWVGTYPFRGIPRSSLNDLDAKCQQMGIRRVIVSAFENLFWQNGLDAVPIWIEKLSDHPLCEYWPVVNPVHPGQLRRLEKLLDKYPHRGVRLVPNYHGYALWDKHVERLMVLAKQRHLVVQVFVRIADERWHWMLKMQGLDLEHNIKYLTSIFDENRILLSGLNGNEIVRLATRLKLHPDLYADVSRMRGPVFAAERLGQSVPMKKIIFGSLWPIQIIEATLWQVTWAQISEFTKRAVLNDNFEKLVC